MNQFYVYLLLLISSSPFAQPSQTTSKLDEKTCSQIAMAIAKAIDDKQIPGAVLLVGHKDEIIYKKAFGSMHMLEKLPYCPMTVDTIFDLASLTKVFTALSIILLAQEGLIHLRSTASSYIPEFKKDGKEAITLEQLLLHTSGLPADNDLSEFYEDIETTYNNIYALPLKAPPGTNYMYSDIGYIILGKIIQKVSGKKLDAFMHERIFEPLNMRSTCFLPRKTSDIAPTGERNGEILQGKVHDPRAHLLGGIAGHAGLFSNVDDLAIFCSMILKSGTYKNTCIASKLSIARMTRPHYLPEGNIRGLGFDISTEHSSCIGDFFPLGTLAHTGFTGTSFILDPLAQIFIIILTNRVLIPGGTAIPLRASIANIVASSLAANYPKS